MVPRDGAKTSPIKLKRIATAAKLTNAGFEVVVFIKSVETFASDWEVANSIRSSGL